MSQTPMHREHGLSDTHAPTHPLVQVKYVNDADCKKWINIREMVLYANNEYTALDQQDLVKLMQGHFFSGLWYW